jgi:hypothetical protein
MGKPSKQDKPPAKKRALPKAAEAVKARDAETRRDDGKFGPGNPGGAVLLTASVARARELRAAFFDAVPVEQMRKIVQGVVADAMDGDAGARKLVLEYVMSKRVEITGADGGPVETAQAPPKVFDYAALQVEAAKLNK